MNNEGRERGKVIGIKERVKIDGIPTVRVDRASKVRQIS